MNTVQQSHRRGLTAQVPRPTDHGHAPPLWVRHYDLFVNIVTWGRTTAIHRETLSLAQPNPGDAVLDIGCGTGAFLVGAERILDPGATLVGLDVEPAMIVQAQRRARRRNSRAIFHIASIEDIPFDDDTFDVAFNSLVYHHLSEEARETGFVEALRILKPGAIFVLVDINPSLRSTLASLPGHRELKAEDYVRSEVMARLQSAGFVDIEAGAHPSRQLSYAIGRKAAK